VVKSVYIAEGTQSGAGARRTLDVFTSKCNLRTSNAHNAIKLAVSNS